MQPELAAELAVVARPRLLEALELRGQLLLGEERGAVDAREHRPGRVAAPVGAGDGLQLDRADGGGARGVRSAAQVGERAVAVERHGVDPLRFDEVLDQLDLVVLLLAAEALERLGDADLAAIEALPRGDVLAHLLLDRREVRLGDRDAVREVEVVVEAVLDRRADRDLHARVELHDRGREDVRRVVADEVERVLPALGRDDLQRGAVVERPREVAHLAVDPDGERRAGEPGADRGGRVGAGGAIGKVELRAVGQGDVHRGRCYARRPRRTSLMPVYDADCGTFCGPSGSVT